MKEELLGALEKGNIKLYELEKIIWKGYGNDPGKWSQANKEASLIRLGFIRKKTGKALENIEECYVDNSSVRGDNPLTGIEQKIGGASTPLGIAGPVKIMGEYAKGDFYVPMASNEAAQIAGMNRGFKAINEAGGINVIVTRDHMARAPVLEAPDITKAREVCDVIKSKGGIYKKVKEACESESRVSKLLDIQPFQLGRLVHIRFLFHTGDSMGMNSATKYSANGVRVLLENYPWLKLKSLTGNMCTDKKASHINVLLGRGKAVETEIIIPARVIRKNYNIYPDDIVELNRIKNYEGSALSGTLTGFNANAANAIASIFVATGQDCAQIVESSTCFTRAGLSKGNLVFGVTLPCLEIATTGGGTDFGTARECLEILGCGGPGKPPGSNVRKLAEIVGAAVAAQELNLLGAEAHGYELAESHIRLARGK